MEETTAGPIKIAILGPESSGKSTLAKALASHFNGNYVEEFARLYLEKNGSEYSFQDLDFFAQQQLKLETNCSSSGFLFCDTNPLSIKIWSLYKYGTVSSVVNQLATSSFYDFHLLLQPDLPYEEDPLREDSPQKNRDELFQLFENQLQAIKATYTIIGGVHEARLNNAINCIRSHFSF